LTPFKAVHKKEFQKRLLEWHYHNKRLFPWRTTEDPYAILVAEFLLQKTDAEKAESAYKKVLESWPSADALAQADSASLQAVFRSIGLLYRARRLKKAMVEIAEKHSGKVPDSFEELKRLPGVGRYMANAVLCFAYGKAVPLIDLPTSRVLLRVFNYKPAKKRAREDKKFWEFAASLIPSDSAREYNFALLDFANIVCTPRNPKCSICILKDLCSFSRGAGNEN